MVRGIRMAAGLLDRGEFHDFDAGSVWIVGVETVFAVAADVGAVEFCGAVDAKMRSGIVGAFLGYGIRRRLDLQIKDIVVAVCEDVVAVGLALFLVSR